MSIYDRIIKLLAEHTGKDASEFTPETTFESLGIDSLETVEMVRISWNLRFGSWRKNWA